jgi:hypothetical protein
MIYEHKLTTFAYFAGKRHLFMGFFIAAKRHLCMIVCKGLCEPCVCV